MKAKSGQGCNDIIINQVHVKRFDTNPQITASSSKTPGNNINGPSPQKKGRTIWQRDRNILAYPYGWQRPAKTEEWAYERCLESLPESHFVEIVAFPWATLVDLLRNGQENKAVSYIHALQCTPPRRTLLRVTVCQHIFAKDMLPYFKRLGITDFFWPHAVIHEQHIDGIRIHPFPLYPVRYEDLIGNNTSSIKPLSKRNILYSFIGAHEPDLYLSSARQWINELPQRKDAIIQLRSAWHYEKHVYGEQVAGQQRSKQEIVHHDNHSEEYTKILKNTVFSLCPSGSGPNSIRLWESIAFGCIPVILSDQLSLPGDYALWQSAAIFIGESKEEVANLPAKLEALIVDEFFLIDMQAAGRDLWCTYGIDSFIKDIISISQLENIASLCSI